MQQRVTIEDVTAIRSRSARSTRRARAAALAVAGALSLAFAAPRATAEPGQPEALAQPTPSAQPSAVQPPAVQEGRVRYVQAGPSGARARNLYDAQGIVVRDLPAGTVLAVHGERAGWLDVEAPGGFQVWVYGKYVRPAGEAGVVEITGSRVLMRPLPSSGPESLPLSRRFELGETVRLIRRNDSSRSLSEDWVQVWSPPGARAWVRAAETTPVASGEDGARLWSQAVAAALEVPAAAKPTAAEVSSRAAEARPAAAPARTQDAARASDLLRRADELLANERRREEAGGQPNYTAAISAYEEVLAVIPAGPTADLATRNIKLAESYAEARQIRLDLENQKLDYESQLAQREEEKEAARDRDVFEGRFAERGWLERRETVDGEPVWVLNFAGGDAAQLVCNSGRYELGLFRDFEIGVNGSVITAELTSEVGRPVRPRTIDVAAIEVISGRRRR